MDGLELLVKKADALQTIDLFSELSVEEKELNRLMVECSNMIFRARKSAGLSQKQLAKKLNVSQSVISQWESGDVNFSISTLVKIMCALQMRISILTEASMVGDAQGILSSGIDKYKPALPQANKIVDFQARYEERKRM